MHRAYGRLHGVTYLEIERERERERERKRPVDRRTSKSQTSSDIADRRMGSM